MRLIKKFTINKYINMKCCWRSPTVVNHNENNIDDISLVNEKYLDFDIKNYPHQFLGEGHYGKCYKITLNKKEYTCKKIKYLKNNKFNNNLNLSGLLFIITSLLPILPSGSFFTSHAATFFWINFAMMCLSQQKLNYSK